MKGRVSWGCAALALAGIAAGGCARGAAAEHGTEYGAEYGEAYDAPPGGGSDVVADPQLRHREPGSLAGVSAAPVHGRVGPDGEPFEVTLRTFEATQAGHVRRFGTLSLPLQLRVRTPDLTQYPCTSCHVGRTLVLADERAKDAHVDLITVHPAETGATCATCHAADDVEQLALRTGEHASLDHAYRVCAQCHFGQVEAWAAGAHGKRLDGWQGRRVVMGCSDCHDPHTPALETRLPYKPPRLHRPGSRKP
jgi:hypothetical protein